ncbi:MAG: LuxR C-terminal-related transcriptional regulator [Phycisphaerales bacterium]
MSNAHPPIGSSCEPAARIAAESVRHALEVPAPGAREWLESVARTLAALIAAERGAPCGTPRVSAALVRARGADEPTIVASASSLGDAVDVRMVVRAAHAGSHPVRFASAALMPDGPDLWIMFEPSGPVAPGACDSLIALSRGLCPTLASIAADRVWIPLTRRRALIARLTPAQHEIVLLLSEGRTEQEVAAMTRRSPSTVRGHIKTIYDRLRVSTRADLLRAWNGAPPRGAAPVAQALP